MLSAFACVWGGWGSGMPEAVATSMPATTALTVERQSEAMVDLARRRDELTARVAELQWDLGGLVYEMAIRDQIRVDVIVRRAAALQDADAELGEVERILRMEQTGTAGSCVLRSAAQQRRGLLLAVRSAAARAGLKRRDRQLAARRPARTRGTPQPKRPVT